MGRQLGWLSTSFPMSGASHFGCWLDLSEGARAIRGALLLVVRGGASSAYCRPILDEGDLTHLLKRVLGSLIYKLFGIPASYRALAGSV
jgi:hypothetical protein